MAVTDWEKSLASGAVTSASTMRTKGLTASLMGAVVRTGVGSKARHETDGILQLREKKRVKRDLTEAREVVYGVENLNL